MLGLPPPPCMLARPALPQMSISLARNFSFKSHLDSNHSPPAFLKAHCGLIRDTESATACTPLYKMLKGQGAEEKLGHLTAHKRQSGATTGRTTARTNLKGHTPISSTTFQYSIHCFVFHRLNHSLGQSCHFLIVSGGVCTGVPRSVISKIPGVSPCT